MSQTNSQTAGQVISQTGGKPVAPAADPPSPRTRGQLLAEGLVSCKPLFVRYLAGFDDTNHTAQAPGLPNHVAWSLGHCALTMHRTAEKLIPGEIDPAKRPLPASDFLTADGRGGTRERFDTESIGFGSKPAADPGLYPTFQRCREIYESACDRFAGVLRSVPDEALDSTTPWGPTKAPISLWALGQRMVFHNGMHCGQVADLRRALGFKTIL
jgi:hypothetical protein